MEGRLSVTPSMRLLTLLLVSLSACQSAELEEASADDCASTEWAVAEECRCQPERVVLGTGVTSFVELPSDGVAMVHGPQGGWHFPAAVRVENSLDVVTIQTMVYDEETSTPLTELQEVRVHLVSDGACTGYYANLILYLDHAQLAPDRPFTDLPAVLSCREVVVNICVEDERGWQGCSDDVVLMRPDLNDVESGLVEPCR